LFNRRYYGNKKGQFVKIQAKYLNLLGFTTSLFFAISADGKQDVEGEDSFS